MTKNLAAALRQLRVRTTFNNEELCLWTDALCINQRDVLERQLLVTHMQAMFNYAEAVWIWLGDTDPLIEQGLIALVQASAHYETHVLRPDHPARDSQYAPVSDVPDEADVKSNFSR